MSTAENEIMKKIRKDIRVGVSSIENNLAKLNEDLIDNDELQEKLDRLINQFHIKYNDFEQKINEMKKELQTCRLNLKQQSMK